METEYDESPLSISQHAGERSAQRIEVHLGERSLALIARHSFICGICLALVVVCAGICWWTITENRVTQSKLDYLSAIVEAKNAKQ